MLAGALTETGADFDRHACYAVCLENGQLHSALGLADVCGKCASIVPCSFTNPVARLESATPWTPVHLATSSPFVGQPS